jgi:hypothetical protein
MEKEYKNWVGGDKEYLLNNGNGQQPVIVLKHKK